MKISDNSHLIPVSIPHPIDAPLSENVEIIGLKIVKEDNDPIATRISIGGKREIGLYLVFRGDFAEVKKIIQLCLENIQGLKDEDFEV